MAKRLFLLAAGALALSACTSEDVLDDAAASRNLIRFENVVNKPSRAVVDLTTGTLQHFNVFGFYTKTDDANIAHAEFDNVTVTNGGSGIWNYDKSNARYWVPGATYYFYAYSCGSVEGPNEQFKVDMAGQKAASTRVLEIENYICDNTHQHDLIVASNTGLTITEGYNNAVSLQFTHALSKLKAKFTVKDFLAGYDVVIKNVSVRNIRNQGNYKFGAGWETLERSDFSPFVYLQNTTGEGNQPKEDLLTAKVTGELPVSVETNSAYVIPCAYSSANVSLYFEVDVMHGNDPIITGVPLTATFKPEWQEGYSYLYNVEVTPESLKMNKITFTVEMSDWADDNGTNSEDHSTNLPID